MKLSGGYWGKAMEFDFGKILEIVRLTVFLPRHAARWIIDLRLPANIVGICFALTVVLSAMLSAISAKLSPFDLEPKMVVMFSSPFMLALVQVIVFVIVLMIIQGLGHAFGGIGAFTDALLLLVWLELVLIAIQAVQLVLLFFSLKLALLVGLISFVLFLWVLANFIAELHGFASVFRVMWAMFVVLLIISRVLQVFGVGTEHV